MIVLLAAVVGIAGGVAVAARHNGPQPEPMPDPTALVDPRQAAQDLFIRQAAGLLRGDRQTWLSVLAPGDEDLRAEYSALFDTLRGLEVGRWDQTVERGGYGRSGEGEITVATIYCFGGESCAAQGSSPKLSLSYELSVMAGELRLATIPKAASADNRSAVPWLSAGLRTKVGRRTVVAASAELTGTLNRATIDAEAAAAVADRYGRPAPAARYVIFLATAKQFHTWYGGTKDLGRDPVAYAKPLTPDTYEVVVNVTDPSLPLRVVIQHELGHVVTLTGLDRTRLADIFYRDEWAVEGVAEYIAWSGRSPASFYRLDAARNYFMRHQLTTVVKAPFGDDSAANNAAYALGYLFVRCIADRFGDDKMLAFVTGVIFTGLPDRAVIPLGMSFTRLDRTCIADAKRIMF